MLFKRIIKTELDEDWYVATYPENSHVSQRLIIKHEINI